MRLAVVLFNLGGPDDQDAVQPFLFNLFNDPAIIGLPNPFRWMLAKFISKTRTPSAQENYKLMGGGSPLVPETVKQVDALEAQLNSAGIEAKCFIAMRYWKPFTEEAVKSVEAYAPDKIILLPLYPQYSTTTTASSVKEWYRAGGGLATTICCYPTLDGVVRSHVSNIVDTWKNAGSPGNIRVLLSAHGLPEKVVKGGDPYQWQVEQTSAAIKEKLPSDWEVEVCYQSRVGPLKWIGPSTDESIIKAGQQGMNVIVSPVAFVSEHIETLVELDIEYGELAKHNGVKTYLRAPALGVAKEFISGLADLTRRAALDHREIFSENGVRICPHSWKKCPMSEG